MIHSAVSVRVSAPSSRTALFFQVAYTTALYGVRFCRDCMCFWCNQRACSFFLSVHYRSYELELFPFDRSKLFGGSTVLVSMAGKFKKGLV